MPKACDPSSRGVERPIRGSQDRTRRRVVCLLSAGLLLLLNSPLPLQAGGVRRVRRRARPGSRGRREEEYNSNPATWGFRVGASNRRAQPEAHEGNALNSTGLPGISHSGVVSRDRIREAVHVRARPHAARPGMVHSADPSQELVEALAKELQRHNATALPLSGEFLLNYINTPALNSLLRGERRRAQPGGGPLLAARGGRRGAGLVGVDVTAGALQTAAAGGCELVSAAVDALASCAAHWGVAEHSLPPVRPAQEQPTPPCSRKLNLLLLLRSPPVADGSPLAAAAVRESAWWRNGTLMRGEVLRQELEHQGHRVTLLDAAAHPEDGAAALMEAALHRAHRRHSLDVCVCVGNACARAVPASLAHTMRICHFLGVPVVHDLADMADATEVAPAVDAATSSSRLMKLAVETLSGAASLVTKAQHNNYAAIGQTPEEAMMRPVQRVLIQIEGGEVGGAKGDAIRQAVKRLAEQNNWEVVDGMQALAKHTTASARNRRAVASKRNPAHVGETALGLDQVQAAVLWHADAATAEGRQHHCAGGTSLLLHLMSAGVPTVSFPSLPAVDIALEHGYHLLARSPSRAAQLLQQLADSAELRAMSARRALEIAAKHRARSASDHFVRRICALKHASRYDAEEAAAAATGHCWHCQPRQGLEALRSG
eukprot:jgi/Tetstr1/453097/TSEL_003937.t1